MTGPLTDKQAETALNDPPGAALKTGAASVWTKLAVRFIKCLLKNGSTMDMGGNTRNCQAWKMTAPGSTSRIVFLASPSYAWAAASPPRWPSVTSPPWLAAGRLWPLSGYCCLHNATQLFYFNLPDTGYCCLQNTIVSLQSTWHRLLLSVQRNCFTSVYRQVTAACKMQLFHFSLPDTG